MSLNGTIGWRWRVRLVPPEPRAVVAWGTAARRLLGRVQALDAARLTPLQATANAEALVVVADEAAHLPWAEGVSYAAPCEAAPGLWLPTLHEPDQPIDLIARALQSRHQRQPVLLWAEPPAVLPLDRLLPLTPWHLQRIEAHWNGHEVAR